MALRAIERLWFSSAPPRFRPKFAPKTRHQCVIHLLGPLEHRDRSRSRQRSSGKLLRIRLRLQPVGVEDEAPRSAEVAWDRPVNGTRMPVEQKQERVVEERPAVLVATRDRIAV